MNFHSLFSKPSIISITIYFSLTSKNFIKSKHRQKMLSLSNVFSEEDLINFEKKIINFLDFQKNTLIEYSVEPKIDGISASLTYKKGILASGLSRGDGEQGELITDNLKTVKDIPHKITAKDFPEDICPSLNNSFLK